MILQEAQFFDLETPSGPMRTHIFAPAAPQKYPGIVLWSEIFQVTEAIARLASWLAGHGFVVAVPEIYHEFLEPGLALPYDEIGGARGNELKTTKTLQQFDGDARAALDFLQTHAKCNGNLGTIGVCIGGHLAFRAAFNADVLASVCFYATDLHKRGLGAGTNDDSLHRSAEIKGETLMIWGRQDPHVPREGRRAVYDAMSDAEVNFQWLEVNGAHAFLRDIGPRYNSSLANQCLSWAIEVFNRKLR
ncbi:carboxymethylenebutenolidase [Abditibacterium utsteinense]|uniref:Carboxymethylenebutenolidase n=1 Tax=Abditibacterium utsteinense TaxID=1960156 RepID=A0A2S8SUC0_9BACT|nr:dienelactone hydrolase family protein [Abditibacterium utsteinense]PQV64394.1 carboxymethylenebutenolidase [Abditibacterium utsteinense]